MTWLDDVVAVYGEPKIKPPTDAGWQMYGDGGSYVRWAYAWFPANQNHHISIDSFPLRTFDGAYFMVRIGSHLSSMASIELRSSTEPDDEQMRKLLDVTGFLSTGALAVS